MLSVFMTVAFVCGADMTAKSKNATKKAGNVQIKKRNEKFGIDVSHHNGLINWKKVAKGSKPLFVYVKATEGAGYVDKDYTRNITEARKEGLKVGSYHFFRMTSGAHAQFRNFINTVGDKKQDLIPMVDIETTDGRSRRAVLDSLKVFLNLLERHYGVRPLIYSHNSHYNDICAPELNKYPLYIARYHYKEPAIKGKGTYTIWQYSETGRIDGIPERVDLARFHSGSSVKNILLGKNKIKPQKKPNDKGKGKKKTTKRSNASKKGRR